MLSKSSFSQLRFSLLPVFITHLLPFRRRKHLIIMIFWLKHFQLTICLLNVTWSYNRYTTCGWPAYWYISSAYALKSTCDVILNLLYFHIEGMAAMDHLFNFHFKFIQTICMTLWNTFAKMSFSKQMVHFCNITSFLRHFFYILT